MKTKPVRGQLGEEAPCRTRPHRPLGPSRSPGSSTRRCQSAVGAFAPRTGQASAMCVAWFQVLGHSSELHSRGGDRL